MSVLLSLQFRPALMIFTDNAGVIDETSAALPAAIIKLDRITGTKVSLLGTNFLLMMFTIPSEMMHCTGTQKKEARNRSRDRSSH